MNFEFIRGIVNSEKDEKYVVFDLFGNCELCKHFRRLEAKFSKVFMRYHKVYVFFELYRGPSNAASSSMSFANGIRNLDDIVMQVLSSVIGSCSPLNLSRVQLS